MSKLTKEEDKQIEKLILWILVGKELGLPMNCDDLIALVKKALKHG